jgi:hypothetical protein
MIGGEISLPGRRNTSTRSVRDRPAVGGNGRDAELDRLYAGREVGQRGPDGVRPHDRLHGDVVVHVLGDDHAARLR